MSVPFHLLLSALLGGAPGILADEESRQDPEPHHLIRLLTESGTPLAVRTLAFSPDGATLLVSTAQGGTMIIRTRDGEVVGEYDLAPFSMAFSRDGTRLLLISERDTVLLDTRRWSPVPIDDAAEPGYVGLRFERRGGRILVSELTPGGPVEALGSVRVGDELVSVGDGRGGPMTEVLGRTVEFAQEQIAGPAGTFVRLGIIARGETSTETHTVPRQALRRDGNSFRFLPAAAADAGENLALLADRQRRYVLRSARTGRVVARLSPEAVESIGQHAISPDGERFALLAGRIDGPGVAIELFEVVGSESTAVVPFPGETWYQVAFTPDGSRLLVGTWDTVEILDLERGEFIEPLPLAPPGSGPEDARPAGGDPAAAAAIRSADRNAFGPSGGPAGPRRLRCLAASPRGLVAVGGQSGAVGLWDLGSRKLLHLIEARPDAPVEHVAFSPDGRWLASYLEGELHLLDVSGIRAEPGSGPDPGGEAR
nr:hypothetical protein [bacterium]